MQEVGFRLNFTNECVGSGDRGDGTLAKYVVMFTLRYAIIGNAALPHDVFVK